MHVTLKLQYQVVPDKGVLVLLTRRLVVEKVCSVNQSSVTSFLHGYSNKKAMDLLYRYVDQ